MLSDLKPGEPEEVLKFDDDTKAVNTPVQPSPPADTQTPAGSVAEGPPKNSPPVPEEFEWED